MLAKIHRLRHTTDIQSVRRAGTCQPVGPLRVCVLKKETGPMRTACVVGKRVHASAVKRHRLQRLLREFVRSVQKQVGNASYDMVISAQRPANTITTMAELMTLEDDVLTFLKKHV